MKRSFSIRRTPSTRFWLIGAPRNWQPGDDWLIAHDVFHHLADDDGSVEREIMSFGMEAWLESSSVSIQDTISSNVMSDTLYSDFDNGITLKKLSRLILAEAPPPNCNTLSNDLYNFFTIFARDALTSLVGLLSQRKKLGSMRDSLLSQDNSRKWADWLRHGYRIGQQCYPTPKAYLKAFDLLRKCVVELHDCEVGRFTLTQDACLIAENKAAARSMVSAINACSADCAQLIVPDKFRNLIKRAITELPELSD